MPYLTIFITSYKMYYLPFIEIGDDSLGPHAAPQLIVLVILVILSAFFSSAETALTTMNRLRLRTLMEEGSKNAAIAMKLVQNPGKLLSTILIGNNIVNLSASSLSTVFATNLCIQAGTPIPVSTAVVSPQASSHWLSYYLVRFSLRHCHKIF